MIFLRSNFLILFAAMVLSAKADQKIPFFSPDKTVQIEFNWQSSGALSYQLLYKGKTVIAPSALGMVLNNPGLEMTKFVLEGVDSSAVDETWNPVWGEVKSIRNNYRELLLKLAAANDTRIKLEIIFRVFNEGVGFRYHFPQQPNLNHFIIGDEMTEFRLTGNHKAFWIPGDYDTNEYPYYETNLSEIDATG
jgi:hypothetical protein